MTQDRERSEFEAWASDPARELSLNTMADNNDYYSNRVTRTAWESWQAAKASEAEVNRLLSLVNQPGEQREKHWRHTEEVYVHLPEGMGCYVDAGDIRALERAREDYRRLRDEHDHLESSFLDAIDEKNRLGAKLAGIREQAYRAQRGPGD